METTQPTETVWFDTDRNGRKIAFRWMARSMRACRMNVTDAETAIATGQAHHSNGHPITGKGW